VPLTLTNVPPTFVATLEAPLYPQKPQEEVTPPERVRNLVLSRNVFVEQENCRATSDAAFYGFYPGQLVRLRYGPLVECKKVECDAKGNVIGLEGVAWLDGVEAPGLVSALPVFSVNGRYINVASEKKCALNRPTPTIKPKVCFVCLVLVLPLRARQV